MKHRINKEGIVEALKAHANPAHAFGNQKVVTLEMAIYLTRSLVKELPNEVEV